MAWLIGVLAFVVILVLIFLVVKKVVHLFLGIVVVLLVIAVCWGLLVHLGGGEMPPILDNLFTFLGNVVRSILDVFSDVFRVGAAVTRN